MSSELIRALDQLEKERGIEKEVLVEAIEAALVSAYKKNFGSSQEVRISIDRDTGEVKVFALKRVTAIPKDENSEISLEEARKMDNRYEEEDLAEIEVTPRKFGRIAAQTAKNVVLQRIRKRNAILI